MGSPSPLEIRSTFSSRVPAFLSAILDRGNRNGAEGKGKMVPTGPSPPPREEPVRTHQEQRGDKYSNVLECSADFSAFLAAVGNAAAGAKTKSGLPKMAALH